jgi:hypothetical protein
MTEQVQLKKEKKKKRSTAKGSFHRIYNSLEQKISAGSESIEVLSVMLADLENAYDGFQQKSDEFGEVLDSENDDIIC